MTVLSKVWQKGGTGATALAGLGNVPQGYNVAKYNIDINKILNGTNNISALTIATGDQLPIMTIPAGMAIVGINAQITTAFDANGGSIALGDSTSASRFIATWTTLTANTYPIIATTANPLAFYSTADNLLLKLTGTWSTASVGAVRFVVAFRDDSADPIATTQA